MSAPAPLGAHSRVMLPMRSWLLVNEMGVRRVFESEGSPLHNGDVQAKGRENIFAVLALNVTCAQCMLVNVPVIRDRRIKVAKIDLPGGP